MKTYCCYGAFVEVGCDASCPTKATPAADPVVGHKTFSDGTGGYRHEPLHQSEAKAYLAAAEAAKEKRAADMPTEEDAARAMWSAWQRLRELGWRETMYGPTNERVRTISHGSSGIHIGSRHEPWPEKTWWPSASATSSATG